MVTRKPASVRVSPPSKRKLLRLSIASVFAGSLACGFAADARIVSVQLSAPTLAFGGYSWPGVGLYR